jgi:glutaredoxin 2
MQEDFTQILKTHFRGTIDHRITDMTHIMLSIRCPLFVQLTFSEHSLLCSAEKAVGKPEAYIPNITDINAQNLETSQMIQQDIEVTTEALLINPQAYQHDNCDLFISQVISPISVYNTIIVCGSLTSWMRYIEQSGLPRPVEAYRKAIEATLNSEWNRVIQTMRQKDGSKKR